MALEFIWDDKKNSINKVEHGVSFEDAIVVFYDPKKFEIYDWKHSLFEERWNVFGLSGLTVLAVNFTERNGSVRIISARKADKNEVKEYFYGYGKI